MTFNKTSLSSAQLKSICKSLRIGRYITENMDNLIEELCASQASPRETISTFLSEICQARDLNKQQMLLSMACLPNDASLDNFDFSVSSVNEAILRELAECRWIDEHRNIIIHGDPGLGKTHLACALGRQAIIRGYSTLFISANKLLAALDKARNEHCLQDKLSKLCRNKLLIIDEVGYPTTGDLNDAAALLYTLIDARYERLSTVITTNRSFDEWPKYLGGDVKCTKAIIDRFLHHSIQIPMTGESYRLRDFKKKSMESKEKHQ